MRPFLIVALIGCAGVARAQSDPCSWITPAQLTKEFGGKPFPAVEKTTAIPAYRGQNPGVNCRFVDTHHGLHVLKGKTRFFVDVGMSNPTGDEHAHHIATAVLPNA